MSTIIYEEFPLRTGGMRFNFANADATKKYIEHYENWKMLQFISTNNLATFQERAQARKELTICERKLEYWKRHANFNTEEANQQIVQINKNWRADG